MGKNYYEKYEVSSINQKIRLLLVYSPHENWQTGASQTFMKIVNKINKNIFDIVVLVQKEDPNIAKIKAMDNVKLIRCTIPSSLDLYGGKLLRKNPVVMFKRFSSLLNYHKKVKKVIRDINPDLIWSLNWRGVLSVSPVVDKRKIPFVYQIGLGIESKGIKSVLNAILLNLSSAIFIESKAQIANLYSKKQAQKHKNKFYVLPFGIDTEKFSKNNVEEKIASYEYLKDEEYFVIGSVCQLKPRKGVDELIKMVAKIRENKQKKVHLVIVGGDPSPKNEYLNYLNKLIAENELQNQIHLVGWQDQNDIPQWLNILDLFVLYTQGEGIPVSIRESMAMNIPVISTNVGGISDIIEDGYNGRLVELNDSELFTSAIVDLINDSEKLECLGNNARKTVEERFSLDKQIHEYEKIFMQLYEI